MGTKRDLGELLSGITVGTAVGILKNMKDIPQLMANLNAAEVGAAYCALGAAFDLAYKCNESGFLNTIKSFRNLDDISSFVARSSLRFSGGLFGDATASVYGVNLARYLEHLFDITRLATITKQT